MLTGHWPKLLKSCILRIFGCSCSDPRGNSDSGENLYYLGQTHLGTPFQVPAWVRKFSLGSTGDEISSLIIIQSLFVQQKFKY